MSMVPYATPFSCGSGFNVQGYVTVLCLKTFHSRGLFTASTAIRYRMTWPDPANLDRLNSAWAVRLWAHSRWAYGRRVCNRLVIACLTYESLIWNFINLDRIIRIYFELVFLYPVHPVDPVRKWSAYAVERLYFLDVSRETLTTGFKLYILYAGLPNKSSNGNKCGRALK